jgi:hypothetical protein
VADVRLLGGERMLHTRSVDDADRVECGRCVEQRGWQDRGVPEPTQRLIRRIRANFAPGTAEEVVRRLRGLPEERFGGQDAERIQAALVFQSGGS